MDQFMSYQEKMEYITKNLKIISVMVSLITCLVDLNWTKETNF